jgi:hypothetical protein
MQWGAVVAQADVHADLPKRRLGSIGPTETVPPGDRKAQVRIALDRARRVVDAVHVRGHDNPASPAVVTLWQRHVAVLEDRRSVQEHFEGHDRPRHGAQQHDSRLPAAVRAFLDVLHAQAPPGKAREP